MDGLLGRCRDLIDSQSCTPCTPRAINQLIFKTQQGISPADPLMTIVIRFNDLSFFIKGICLGEEFLNIYPPLSRHITLEEMLKIYGCIDSIAKYFTLSKLNPSVGFVTLVGTGSQVHGCRGLPSSIAMAHDRAHSLMVYKCMDDISAKIRSDHLHITHIKAELLVRNLFVRADHIACMLLPSDKILWNIMRHFALHESLVSEDKKWINELSDLALNIDNNNFIRSLTDKTLNYIENKILAESVRLFKIKDDREYCFHYSIVNGLVADTYQEDVFLYEAELLCDGDEDELVRQKTADRESQLIWLRRLWYKASGLREDERRECAVRVIQQAYKQKNITSLGIPPSYPSVGGENTEGNGSGSGADDSVHSIISAFVAAARAINVSTHDSYIAVLT